MTRDGTPVDWSWLPPDVPAATHGCVVEGGSLTERLIASGRRFAVDPLFLGETAAAADEAAALGVAAGDRITARHVALTLDDVTVVVARSFCRPGCPVWHPILDRGGRSLGFTLFSGEVPVTRAALEFATLDSGHPLFALARTRDPGVVSVPARRCRFLLEAAPLYVCEAFLPALETMLPDASRVQQGAAR